MKNTLLACLLAICALHLSLSAYADDEHTDLILVEAEAFDDVGGWVVDQQFMDQMGSPYMLAHGLGVPVPNSKTEVQVSSPGKYRVWVRTRDWVAPWKAPGAPGKFQLLVDGQPLSTTFGTEGAQWHWQDGGIVQLSAKVELQLHDLTGFEGRCDAILLAADLNSTPPDGGKELAVLRGKLLGWDNQPKDGGEYDLVVVGGGFAGSCAAITAARMGLTVALIQDRPVLGGNGSSEVRVWPEGFTNHAPYPRIGDVVEEFQPYSKLKDHPNPKGYKAFNDQRKLDLVESEPNITLLLEYRVNAAEAKNDAVQSVVAQHTRSGRRVRLTGRWFLDSTGDGVLGALVGANYEYTEEGHMGTTNLWDFGETNETEHELKCLCEDFEEQLSLNFTAATQPQPFPRCSWAVDLSDVDFPGRHREKTFNLTGTKQLGTWFWESGFNKDPIADGEWIRDLNLRAMYGAWDVLKNIDGKFPNHRLKWAAFIGGKRESRRLMGDVVVTAEDFRDGTEFEDAAVPCTWHIDIHSPHPDYFEQGDEDAFFSTFTRGKEYQYEGPYWAPYRCLYSRNIDNLFMAGRDISVSHDGLGAVRVMRTCGMMGEIVGMAASVCKTRDCTPRDVYKNHLAELQTLMRKGAGKPHPSNSDQEAN
ncbi:FAD-dependent oxidoreductase [Adhaeretor mobilis]|nr:FAD-dependent oxidoreductase [Adhaeretor mobilis]